MADICDAVLPDSQTTPEGKAFEKEIDGVLGGERRDHPLYIGGQKIGSGHLFYVGSPIDETIMYGSFQEPEKGTMVAAVEAAQRSVRDWAKLSSVERAACFKPYIATLKARRMHYAALVTVSSGMVMREALAEVDFLIEALERMQSDAAGFGKGKGGVWAVFSQHNSPLASPVAYAVAAMIAGNAVIMYPSNTCPLPVFDFYSVMERTGLPGGVLNVVVDRLEAESTAELANDMRLRGIVASGSGKRMEDMQFLMIDDELRFINNIKGMSPCIVYRPGSMKQAAKAIIDSAFSFSGQRIHSCSKVIVTMDEQKELMACLVEDLKDLRISDPVNDTAFSGPVISCSEGERFRDIVAENAEFVVAKAPRCTDSSAGNYISPVIMAGLDEENELEYMDSGLPILCVKVVSSLDQAFEELSNTECGMSAGLFSKDAKTIDRFKKEADAPVLYINRSSTELSPVVGADLDLF